MTVRIDQPDALKLMAQVEGKIEGPEWLSHQDGMGATSFQAFRDEWRKATSDLSPESLQSEYFHEACITVDGGGAIYGWWGWNRYAVQLDGEIVFLAGFSRSSECTERARSLGFKVKP